MPRTFWYNLSFALACAAVSTLVAFHRGTYPENVLYGVFSTHGAGPSAAGFLLACALLAAAAWIAMRVTGGARTCDLLGVFGLALFVPFTFLASRFRMEALGVLLLAGAVLFLLGTARGFKNLVPAFALLLLSMIARGELAYASLAVAGYLLLARRPGEALVFIAFFALCCAAAVHLSIGAAGDIRRLGVLVSGFREAYSAHGLIDVFRWSLQVQLLSAFLPFLLVAWTSLTVTGIPQDRAALFLILSLSLLPLVMLPGIAHDPRSARLLFMAASLFTILGANSGASLLCKSMAGTRSFRWGMAVGVVFLLPSLLSLF
jgi:hypothetical protein